MRLINLRQPQQHPFPLVVMAMGDSEVCYHYRAAREYGSSMSDDKRAGMQRIRVGLTGLGAVLLIVAISAAIFESARQQPGNEVALNRTEQTVANMVAANATEAPSDPLTEIGVTPGTPAANDSQPSK